MLARFGYPGIVLTIPRSAPSLKAMVPTNWLVELPELCCGGVEVVAPRPIYVNNTMGHSLEELQLIDPGQVKLYTCGPTVYSYQHIGNFRAFIFADTLRRMLEY